MQSDAKEPPVYRGDSSDKFGIREWEELMDTYLRKRGIPLAEQHQEILSRLMGKAKDVVRVTLRCNSALNPVENPKVIMDILKQHFSDVSYSCMPLADFYGTVPLAGEGPVEYWVRLNKAVDLAEEALKRLGRRMEDPCQEAAMMFVKYCPDPTLASVFRLKAPEKWTAQEIQEQLDRYQTELKEQMSMKPKCHATTRRVTAHVQTSHEADEVDVGSPAEPDECSRASPTHTVQSDDNCMRTLISLLDRALSQNVQMPSHQPQSKLCRVCRSHDHSTVTHYRRERLCFACFQPGHSKRDCTSDRPRSGPTPFRGSSALN
ncbi:serine arginine-rich splicing factor 3 isoform X1 [Labeo rohita]|uniref:Serine arginine-rich splicing factor 3 isoform X1 n=1 Tax=Labeo rohita TaxID=84645 RepID=A0A498NU33_LABRO|nr:serine arginine-rich splicing factor 3 isoform X1 [Labeo rohita]